MHRIDTPDATVANLFTDGNPAVPIPATAVDAAWANALQEEVAYTVETEDIGLVKGDNTQLWQAVTGAATRIASGLAAAERTFQSNARGFKYVNANTALSPGGYIVDSQAGSFTLTLPAAPVLGFNVELIDARASWGSNPVTVARNGQTIMGLAENLSLNVSDQRFHIWWNGADWRLL